MRHLKPIIALVAVLCVALSASAAYAGGIYIGGGAGTANIQDSASNPSGVTFDESNAALRLFGGYRFDALPIVSLSGEVGYRDLGKQTASPGGVPAEYRAHGFDYSALAGLGLGPIEVYARLGGIQYDLEKNTNGTTNNFSGSAPLYGIGAQLTLFGLGLRAEYEKIDVKKVDSMQMISVSVLYQF
jgi:hypothetical protein